MHFALRKAVDCRLPLDFRGESGETTDSAEVRGPRCSLIALIGNAAGRLTVLQFAATEENYYATMDYSKTAA